MQRILDQDLEENRRQLFLFVAEIDRGGVSGLMDRGLFFLGFQDLPECG